MFDPKRLETLAISADLIVIANTSLLVYKVIGFGLVKTIGLHIAFGHDLTAQYNIVLFLGLTINFTKYIASEAPRPHGLTYREQRDDLERPE